MLLLLALVTWFRFELLLLDSIDSLTKSNNQNNIEFQCLWNFTYLRAINTKTFPMAKQKKETKNLHHDKRQFIVIH